MQTGPAFRQGLPRFRARYCFGAGLVGGVVGEGIGAGALRVADGMLLAVC